jgi:hypothetical protein
VTRATWLWRAAPPIVGMSVVAAFAILYLDAPKLYFGLLIAWGVDPFRFPFLDAHAVLSALQCARQGLDTYNYNPCDVLTRAFVYSPLILDAAVFPVTIAWNNWTGVALAAVFFLCIASLPAPRGTREWLAMGLAAGSTMSAFAVERGNIDIAIFLLMVLAGHFLPGRPVARAAGYFVILLGAILKFYPAVALVAALRERPRRFFAVAAVSLAVSILFVVHYRLGLEEAMTRVPTGSYFTDWFWAGNLPLGLAVLLQPATAIWPQAAPVLRVLPWLLLALLLFYCARTAFGMTRHAAAVARLPETHASFFVVGTALIVGCFFAGQSLDYRGIFFLLLLPGLLVLAREAEGGRPFRVTAWLIVFLMWGEMFREALQHVTLHDRTAAAVLQTVKAAFWLFREAIWWRVIGNLAGLLLCFAMETAMAKWAVGEIGTGRRALR